MHDSLTTRSRGTPQGSVIDPLLLNLFMHYAFDKWMDKENPVCLFTRYADDAVIHCHFRREAEQLLCSVTERLGECGLELDSATFKVVYCKDSYRNSGVAQ